MDGNIMLESRCSLGDRSVDPFLLIRRKLFVLLLGVFTKMWSLLNELLGVNNTLDIWKNTSLPRQWKVGGIPKARQASRAVHLLLKLDCSGWLYQLFSVHDGQSCSVLAGWNSKLGIERELALCLQSSYRGVDFTMIVMRCVRRRFEEC
jgi:hypothetical protein